MAVRRGRRRAEGFAVRRWLQLGAASAGLGAGLLGFSLLGPQVGTAAADTAGASSTTSTSEPASENAPSESTGGTSGSADPTERDNAGADAHSDADDDADAAEAEAEEAQAQAQAEEAEEAEDRSSSGSESLPADIDDDDTANMVAVEEDSPAPTTPARVVTPKSPAGDWSEVTGRAIDNWTEDSRGWINALPVDNQAKYHLAGALWATKRTLLNQAPTVAPLQITGKLDGPVTGTVGAVDPDGDRLIYVVTKGPKSGSVKLNADGTYTYAPGADFDGVDTFRVVAVDAGPHVNLLDPFRPIGTGATHLLNQRAIKFEFTFTDGAEHWTPERVRALRTAADDLVIYFVVEKPVVLTYDVTGMDDPASGTLAVSRTVLLFDESPFQPTVVQHKLLMGEDANGADADGSIVWNFGVPWALGEAVGPDEYDFNAIAVHELLHSFGFMSYVLRPGDNNVHPVRPIYDRFLVTRDGRRPVGADGRWDDDFDHHITGADGGLYFGGANAVAAYGGPVPLYTPGAFLPGSSLSHLDDNTFTGVDEQIMNHAREAGSAVRGLSEVEIGMLRDLGYRVDAPLRQL